MPPRAHSAAPSTELHQGDEEPDEEGDMYTSGDNTRQQQQQAGSAGEEDDNDNEEAFLFISRLPPLHLCTPAGREAALPPKAASAPPCTLVLDLDETLVHSSLDPGSGVSTAGPHDFAFPVQFEDALHTVYVRKRPGLQAFLEHVVLFTASHPSYANPLLDILDPERRIFVHRLCFDSCLLVDGTYVKDLTVLGRDLSRTAIIDNTPQAFGFHPDNAIPILSWYDDAADTALAQLLPVLDTLAEARDVRPLLAAKFGVAARAQQAAERAFAAALAELASAATASASTADAEKAGAGEPPGAATAARAQAQRAAEAAAEAQASAATARAALLAARQAAAAATETAAKAVAAPPAAQQQPASQPRSKTALIASAVQRAAKRAPSPSLSQSPGGGAAERGAPPPQGASGNGAAARPAAPTLAAAAPAVDAVRNSSAPANQGPPELGGSQNGEAPVTEGEEDDDKASATWRSWSPPPVDVAAAAPQAPPQEALPAPAAAGEREPGPLPRPARLVAPPHSPAAAPAPAPPHPRRVRPAGPSPGWLAAASAARRAASLGWSSLRFATLATAAIGTTAVTGASSVTTSALGALSQAATTAAGAAKRAARAAAGVAGAVYVQATAKAAPAGPPAETAQDDVAPLAPTPVRVRQTATVVLPPSQTPPRVSSSKADAPTTDGAAKQRKKQASREALDPAAAASSLGDWTSDDGGRSWRSTASQQRRTPLPPLAAPSAQGAGTPRGGPSPPPLRRAKPSADGSAVVFIGEVRPRSVGLTGPPGTFRTGPAPVSPRSGGMVGWTTMDGGRTWRRATDTATAPSAGKRLRAAVEHLRSNTMAQAITVALMALMLAVAAR